MALAETLDIEQLVPPTAVLHVVPDVATQGPVMTFFGPRVVEELLAWADLEDAARALPDSEPEVNGSELFDSEGVYASLVCALDREERAVKRVAAAKAVAQERMSFEIVAGRIALDFGL